jgi:redox-sensitive bicupin YhaK (pirin superfamily)
MIEIRKADERGHAQFGWLDSHHTFSFGNYHDPQHMGFSDLIVINDDRVTPSRGFGRHSHADMEIFSYVLEGALEHRDSMGSGSVIRPGDVQLMSAGTGVSHSEFNHSDRDPVHFLQIWIVPERGGLKPSYQESHFADAEKRGRFRLILSPEGAEGSLQIHQDTRVYAALLDGDEEALVTLPEERYAYVHLARGSVEVNGVTLGEGDGARIQGERTLSFANAKGAEVLLFDLRPRRSVRG